MKKCIIVLLLASGSLFGQGYNGTGITGLADGTVISVTNVISQTNHVGYAEKDWYQAVAEGLVDGYSWVRKFGENPLITTGTDPEDIWGGGSIYTFSTTADITQLSSSNAGDTQSIEISGLGANTNVVIQTKTLTGQTPVTLDTPLLYAYRMRNMGATNIAGAVYLSTTGALLTNGVPSVATTRAQINNSMNQTLMAIYPVPYGKTLYLDSWSGAMLRSGSGASPEAVTMTLRVREPGGVFQVKSNTDAINRGSSGWAIALHGLPVTQGSVVLIRCEETTADVGVSAGFDGLLKDN